MERLFRAVRAQGGQATKRWVYLSLLMTGLLTAGLLAMFPARHATAAAPASGAIAPREAIEWICQQPNIESIVFGASSRTNIHNTKFLVDEFWRTV